jgi:hypothetical protein
MAARFTTNLMNMLLSDGGARRREKREGSLFKLQLTTACRKSEVTKECTVGRKERSVLRGFCTGKLLPQQPDGSLEEQPLLAELPT